MSRRELDLEAALADLAADLRFPPTPDLAAAVTARLEEGPARAPAGRRGRRRPPTRRWPAWLSGWRRLAVAGLAAVLLAVAVLVASPGTREAVARRLGLRGVGVQLGGPPPPTVTTRPGERLDLGLGERVTLEEARRRVGFSVLVPGAAGFQQPAAVYVNEAVPAGGRVDLVYRARPGLSASPFTDVGLLVTEFRGQPTPEFLKKVAVLGMVEEVRVGGEPGYWFSGEPHFFTYRDAAGSLQDEQTRLAGNTLVWQRGELTLRIEGEISKQEALRIAESMR
jgi:anti-sigma factor RsiW